VMVPYPPAESHCSSCTALQQLASADTLQLSPACDYSACRAGCTLKQRQEDVSGVHGALQLCCKDLTFECSARPLPSLKTHWREYQL
jgi:hypothetical protein